MLPHRPSSTLFPYTTLFRSANNFLLDGMDNNQVSDNLLGYTPAPDAIEEFNLITNNASIASGAGDRKSTRLNSSHSSISYAVFCLKKKKKKIEYLSQTTKAS